jgi:hypothetical protein
MPPSFSPATAAAELPADSIVPSPADVSCGEPARHSVGARLRRRIAYIGRFIYWTASHRSTKHVRWVLAFEGYSCN